jgi:hypothetical protein
MNISVVFSKEPIMKPAKIDIKDNYTDFQNGILLLKSISAQYLPQLYPDVFYIGPDHNSFTYQNSTKYTKNKISTDKILIDLKWQLDTDWFLGIYSEIRRKDEDHGNDFHLQTRDSTFPNIGIIFIHSF